jgi:hypothetical protein
MPVSCPGLSIFVWGLGLTLYGGNAQLNPGPPTWAWPHSSVRYKMPKAYRGLRVFVWEAGLTLYGGNPQLNPGPPT